MCWRVALIALTLTVPSGVSAATDSCGSSPFFDDSVPKEQRAEMLLRRAMACVREGKPIQSIALFSELIGLQPESMDAYLNRGSAYIQSGQFELGIADFSHVISMKPDAMEAWYNRGTAFVVAHQYDRAIADLTEAIRLRPDTARAYCNRAAAYMEKSDYESALADFGTGIQKDANLPFCYYVRGDLYFKKEDYQKAVDDLTKSLPQRLSRDARVLISLGSPIRAKMLTRCYKSIRAARGVPGLRRSRSRPDALRVASN
jgi:tetratricopeptide (TPR) repeat protein